MAIFTRTLATDHSGAWIIAFNSAELHLYVSKVVASSALSPEIGMAVEDFLATVPSDGLHQRAQEQMVKFLSVAIGESISGAA